MSEPNLSSFRGPVADLLHGGAPKSDAGKSLLALTAEPSEREDTGRPVLGPKGKGGPGGPRGRERSLSARRGRGGRARLSATCLAVGQVVPKLAAGAEGGSP